MTRTGVRGGLIERWAATFARLSMARVRWYTARVRSLAGDGRQRPLVLILGREHYSERRERYPVLRNRDLDKVIRGELADEPTTIYVPGPVDGDRREVRFYALDQDALAAVPRTAIVIPESLILSMQLSPGAWADVDRDGYRYFVFDDGRSQPAGGALGAPNLVALAAGMDPERQPEQWHGSDAILTRLRRGLKSLPASTWWACRNPLPRPGGLVNVAWRPVGLAAAVAVFGYLILTTLYLQGSLSYRERALEVLAPEVQEGLAADTEARELAVRQQALADLWTSRADTQRLWAAVASAVEGGARITQVQLRDERVSISGHARDAAGVLAELTASPLFADVTFDAPVRSDSRGRQNFALSFEFAPVAASGGGSDD
jgi:Tfp pilus assembly protein PilN